MKNSEEINMYKKNLVMFAAVVIQCVVKPLALAMGI